MTKGSLENVAALLREAAEVLVVSHRVPEGDALGSSLALTLGLRSMGKGARLFNADPCPPRLAFLPRVSETLEHRLPRERFDAVVMCDCAEPERIADGFPGGVESTHWIVLDHHRTEAPDFGTLVVQDEEAPATSEMILRLFDLLGIVLTPATATCLYTGLAVDTGNFRFSNTTSRAFRAAARLVEAGADAPGIARLLFEEQPVARLRLMARVLDTLELSAGGNLATVKLTPAMLRETGAVVDDADGLVNYPRSLAGCAVAALLYEQAPDSTRVSLRTSLEPIDVESVARSFGGGGHKHAAGCTIEAPLAEAARLLAIEIEQMLGRVSI